jgi:hypothetical protein
MIPRRGPCQALAIVMMLVACAVPPTLAAATGAAEDPAAVAALHAAIAAAQATLQAGDAAAAVTRYRRIMKREAAAPGVPLAERRSAWVGLLRAIPVSRPSDRLLGLAGLYGMRVSRYTDGWLWVVGNEAARDLVAEDAAALGRDSLERIDGLVSAADWFEWSSQYDRARTQLWEVVRLLAAAHGERDSRLASPLVRIARSGLAMAEAGDEVGDALEWMLRLDFGTGPDAVGLRADIHTLLGDHGVLFGRAGSGVEHYRAAWRELAEGVPDGSRVAAERFGAPRRLRIAIGGSPAAGYELGRVTAETALTMQFTVLADGRLTDVHILDRRSTPGYWSNAVSEAFRRARFRPRLVDGSPVPTRDVLFTFPQR